MEVSVGPRRGRAFWEQLVAEVEGGQSQAETARKHRVSQTWVGQWVKRVREERRRRPQPQLLPVRVTGGGLRRRCELMIDGVRVEFDEGTDPAYIAAVA